MRGAMEPQRLAYARPRFEERQRPRLGRAWPIGLAVVAAVSLIACVVLFRLTQNALIRAAAGMIVLAAVAAFVVPYVLLSALMTRVDGEGLHVRLGPMPWKTFRAGEIASVELSTYDAMREFGGWGVRVGIGGQDDSYTIGGARGVRLTLRNGRRVLVGSDDPDSLATAVRSLLSDKPDAPRDGGDGGGGPVTPPA